ncbi:hypothetical protein BDR05DRAFT_967200 [Suillus weaverae]|nr:hypothetical protein BDR05DRAFT_967200 [Suillus weaverae]
MPLSSHRAQVLRVYLIFMVLRDSTLPPEVAMDIIRKAKQLDIDLKVLEGVKKTRYLQSRPLVIEAVVTSVMVARSVYTEVRRLL